LPAEFFPRCLCVSINEEIVHGIPSNRALREGDIVGLDYGVIYDGFYGDSAVTVGVGT
jgi:methionyl aminopeptidase